MRTNKIIFAILASLVICITSCKYDDAELWDAVDSLDNRLTKVESKLETMNSNINSIGDLVDALQKNLFITDVETLENGYSLKFSDGSQISLLNGKDGKDGIDAPIINVKYQNGKYYWVQTVNGETSWLLDIDGNMVQASGADAVTPLLKVDSDGYWIVSYDKGYTYAKVLDEDGQPVQASGKENDSFFESVEATENELVIVLTDGTEIILPIGEPSPYKAVDLGLSVKWATFNLGATAPSEKGEAYLWGDVTGEGIIGYYEAPAQNQIYGSVYDIVRATWGGKWRMPSVAELNELAENCTWTKKTVNGVDGMEVVGDNNQSIFLPNTGYRMPADGNPGNTFVLFETCGYYWSGESFVISGERFGSMLYWDIENNIYCPGGLNVNAVKMAIRPVKE